MSSTELPRGRAGFTLVEVMVALVLALILGGVIFQVVRGESRFATVQSAREEVQQNSRGALEVIASELRSAQAAGLVRGDSNSVTFALPRIWGISCGGGGGNALVGMFPEAGDVSFALNTASALLADSSGAGDWGPTPGLALSGRATVASLTAINPALGAPGNACAGIRSAAPAAGLVRAYTIAPAAGKTFPVVAAGNTLYLYQLVKYDVAQVSGEWWARRSLGLPSEATQQPLAGPLNGQYGIAFSYFDANGNAIAQPVTALATLKTVARINVTVTTLSRTRGNARLTDTQTTSVVLRNP